MTTTINAGLSLSALISVVCAQNVSVAAEPLSIHIEPQPISAALGEFVRQSGLQLLYPDAAVGTRVAPRVVGTYTADAALSKLLASSGLSYSYVNAQTVAIRTASDERGALTSSEGGGGAPSDEDIAATDKSGEREKRGVPEILVTGSRSLNADIERTADDIQPYVVLSRQMIERSAATNVGDFLRSHLSMNYVSAASDQLIPQTGGGSVSSVALRGLSSNQTLILIDGRRAGFRGISGRSAQADLNSIPLNAIERIEVLPATSSGIYGGSATGGVVNVVLRRDYSGMEASLAYEDSFHGGGAERRVDLNGGFTLNDGRTSIMLSGSYRERSELLIRDRPFYSDYRQERDDNLRANDPVAYFNGGSPPLGTTTNISSVATVDLAYFLQTGQIRSSAPSLVLKNGQSLNSQIASLPAGYSGPGSGSGTVLLQNAGIYNVQPPSTTQSGGLGSSILGAPTVSSFSATLRHGLTSSAELFLTLSAGRNEAEFRRNNITSVFTVLASAPNNPFGQNIRVNVPINVSGADNATSKTESGRAVAGLKLQLTKDWTAATEFSFDRNNLQQSTLATSLTAAATTAISTGAIDVLTAPPAGGFDLSQYYVPGSEFLPSHGIMKTGTLRVAGQALSLPAGQLVITSLLEHRKQEFSQYSQAFVSTLGLSTTRYSPQESTIRSGYIEAQVPLISPSMHIPAVHDADLQLAGRYDEYRNIGGIVVTSAYDPSARPRSQFNSFDPTFGLRVRPLSWITLRGSYGTGFFPPELSLLNPSQPTPQISNLIDRKRNQVIGNLFILSGGNPNLQPEDSKSKSFGFILSPKDWKLRFSVDWTQIEKKNNITSVVFNQFALDNEDVLPGVVIRDQNPATFGPAGVGPIVSFNSSFINATRALTESYDFALDYTYEFGRWGSLQLFSSATKLVKNTVQQFAAQPEFENAGVFTTPGWQGSAALTWSWRDISASWSSRYLDSAWLQPDHAFSAGQGASRIPSETYHDLALQYRFGANGRSMVSGGSVQVGVKNIFDTQPRFFGFFASPPYDTIGSPMLATYYGSVTIQF